MSRQQFKTARPNLSTKTLYLSAVKVPRNIYAAVIRRLSQNMLAARQQFLQTKYDQRPVYLTVGSGGVGPYSLYSASRL